MCLVVTTKGKRFMAVAGKRRAVALQAVKETWEEAEDEGFDIADRAIQNPNRIRAKDRDPGGKSRQRLRETTSTKM